MPSTYYAACQQTGIPQVNLENSNAVQIFCRVT
ncbi:hypothetical protein JW766_02035 [Candidatus Dojkabacteria bacterium]|nr:hypothetical protein [Candidatus Dojkabacteria bacterium]